MLADGNPGLKPTLVLFPGALGDAVCFEPTLDALAAGGPVVLYARGAAASIARLFPARPVVRSLDAPEVAALFSPSGDVAGAKPDPAVDWLTGFGRIASFPGSGEPGARGRLEACGARVAAFPRRPEGVHLCDAFLRAATGEARATARAPRVDCPSAVGDDRTRSPGALPLLLIHPGAGAAARRAPFELLAGIAARWRRCGGDVGVAIGPADGGLAGAWVERGTGLGPARRPSSATTRDRVIWRRRSASPALHSFERATRHSSRRVPTTSVGCDSTPEHRWPSVSGAR